MANVTGHFPKPMSHGEGRAAEGLHGLELGRGTNAEEAERDASRQEADRSRRGLDWLTFFCANLQTGFGPFISVYLTTERWTQTDIGLVLMIGGLVGLFGQIPAGALVDRMASKTLLAGVALALIGLSGLMVALSSFFPIILSAWILHAAASCVLSPSIAIVTLGLVGHAGMSRRLGRNATFGSVGNALGAAGMGAFGYYVSNKAVFFVTAALAIPSILALTQIRHVSPQTTAHDSTLEDVEQGRAHGQDLRSLVTNRALIVMAVSITLFYLAGAAMLPLLGSVLTLRSARSPTILIAACIIIPQVMVAFLSPLVGAKAQTWGRRPLLLIGFAALPVRGLLLGLVTDPTLLVAVQLLDGISASVLGVVIALIAADATRGTGRFALAQGAIGTAMGLGAAFSTTLAGLMSDHFGSTFAFFGLAAIAVVAFVVPALLMPETRNTEA